MEEEISSEASEGDCHPIFTKDPGVWVNYLHKEVCVTAAGGKTHTGRVYTIDPVSQSIVLMSCHDDDINVKVDVIFGHSVNSIVILDEEVQEYESTMSALFKPQSLMKVEPHELKAKREKLKSWLLKNRLPVTAKGEQLNISDALTISPPYDPESCHSTNEIILGKIQGLIKNMPPDIEDW